MDPTTVNKTIEIRDAPNWDGDAEKVEWSCGGYNGESEGSSIESAEAGAIASYRQMSGDTESTVVIVYVSNEDDGYDDDMDGDAESALASAGWGTDEDYGGCCDDDF